MNIELKANTMKPVSFTVEKTKTGFSAFAHNFESFPVGSTGKTVVELKANLLESANLYLEDQGKPPITADHIRIGYDLQAFFEFYPEINVSKLGERIGMNKSLLSDYINGKRSVTEKTAKKVLAGVKELGKELSELEIA